MAFNFNWSPLTADSSFYKRAQELLTAALNKSPKPPIIVDDIIVNELNLGSVPPDLEILEIGDLAEDRFRGIFKMCYNGDAFLTLKTRVQANPLNTYLSDKPSFASPQPLAASSGLTIPLKITLSDIKLSAFIILVFSRQKGLTLVFRNEPLESLKVSSTFDSIPFVRDYLQKEIEGQLRVLLMEEVPAIIHRLSLRLWVPEYRDREDEELARESEAPMKEEKSLNPLDSPPQDPVDSRGNVLDPAAISSLSLDSGSETPSLFSQKNLLRLAALTDSHRTLSLFTPSIRDAVFRAWAGATERGDTVGPNTPSTPTNTTPILSRANSSIASTGSIYTFTNHSDGHLPSRPSLVNLSAATTGLGMGAGRHSRSHAARKKKTRVVNLRRTSSIDGDSSVSDETASETSSTAPSSSDLSVPPIIPEERDEVVTPPRSPNRGVRFRKDGEVETSPSKLRLLTPRQEHLLRPLETAAQSSPEAPATIRPSRTRREAAVSPPIQLPRNYGMEMTGNSAHASSSSVQIQNQSVPIQSIEPAGPGILEQAWMMKMATEIARRAQDKKNAEAHTSGFWEADEREDSPPPAYVS